jgi:hypothetical protein
VLLAPKSGYIDHHGLLWTGAGNAETGSRSSALRRDRFSVYRAQTLALILDMVFVDGKVFSLPKDEVSKVPAAHADVGSGFVRPRSC